MSIIINLDISDNNEYDISCMDDIVSLVLYKNTSRVKVRFHKSLIDHEILLYNKLKSDGTYGLVCTDQTITLTLRSKLNKTTTLYLPYGYFDVFFLVRGCDEKIIKP
ncbi:hypothetical protein [Salmon gill poxvirus]